MTIRHMLRFLSLVSFAAFFTFIEAKKMAWSGDIHELPEGFMEMAIFPAGSKGEFTEADLRTRILENPDDIQARFRLVSLVKVQTTLDQRKIYDTHVKWLVEHHPTHHLFDMWFLKTRKNSEAAAEIRQMWNRHLELAEHKTIILHHGANYFWAPEPEMAKKWLLMGSELEPKEPNWLWRLGIISWDIYDSYRLQDGSDQKLAAIALRYYEKALANSEAYTNMHARVASTALTAGEFDKAILYAGQTLSKEKKSDVTGRMNRHLAHIVIGKVAIERGDVEQAVVSLLAAVNFLDSKKPGLMGAGADLVLAADLLDQGRTKEVLEYLQICKKKLWVEPTWFKEWKSTIRKGRPDEAAMEMRQMGWTDRTNSVRRSDPPWWEEFYW